MKDLFLEYLSMSPRGRMEYLQFIIDLANIAIHSGNPRISEETVEKAHHAREQAIALLEEERRQQYGTRKRDEPYL